MTGLGDRGVAEEPPEVRVCLAAAFVDCELNGAVVGRPGVAVGLPPTCWGRCGVDMRHGTAPQRRRFSSLSANKSGIGAFAYG